jgi:hypothetical protein
LSVNNSKEWRVRIKKKKQIKWTSKEQEAVLNEIYRIYSNEKEYLDTLGKTISHYILIEQAQARALSKDRQKTYISVVSNPKFSKCAILKNLKKGKTIIAQSQPIKKSRVVWSNIERKEVSNRLVEIYASSQPPKYYLEALTAAQSNIPETRRRSAVSVLSDKHFRKSLIMKKVIKAKEMEKSEFPFLDNPISIETASSEMEKEVAAKKIPLVLDTNGLNEVIVQAIVGSIDENIKANMVDPLQKALDTAKQRIDEIVHGFENRLEGLIIAYTELAEEKLAGSDSQAITQARETLQEKHLMAEKNNYTDSMVTKPKICVCGLLPFQKQLLTNEFGDEVDLTCFVSTEKTIKQKPDGNYDRVLYMVRFMWHEYSDYIKANYGKKAIPITKGFSNLRLKLREEISSLLAPATV